MKTRPGDVDHGTRDRMIGRVGHVQSIVYHAAQRAGTTAVPAIGSGSDIEEEGFVREGQTAGLEEGKSHILFPVAVGVVFLAMLVAGALLG